MKGKHTTILKVEQRGCYKIKALSLFIHFKQGMHAVLDMLSFFSSACLKYIQL